MKPSVFLGAVFVANVEEDDERCRGESFPSGLFPQVSWGPLSGVVLSNAAGGMSSLAGGFRRQKVVCSLLESAMIAMYAVLSQLERGWDHISL